MTDITGAYDLNDGQNAGLVIRGVDGAGALQDSFIRITSSTDIIPVTGKFDTNPTSPTANQITFSTAHFPGDILSATFYTGFAIFDTKSLGGVLALSGVWHAQRIQFQGGGKKMLKLVNESGGWFADNHQLEIK